MKLGELFDALRDLDEMYASRNSAKNEWERLQLGKSDTSRRQEILERHIEAYDVQIEEMRSREIT